VTNVLTITRPASLGWIDAAKSALIRGAYRALVPVLLRLFLAATRNGRENRLNKRLGAAILLLARQRLRAKSVRPSWTVELRSRRGANRRKQQTRPLFLRCYLAVFAAVITLFSNRRKFI
jgi:hypothetical protein